MDSSRFGACDCTFSIRSPSTSRATEPEAVFLIHMGWIKSTLLRGSASGSVENATLSTDVGAVKAGELGCRGCFVHCWRCSCSRSSVIPRMKEFVVMAQQSVTVTGQVVGNPVLTKLNTGSEIVRFRVASSRRRRNPNTNEWESYDSLYVGVECWGQLARNVKTSLHVGMSVIATGVFVTSEWTDKEGMKQSRIVLKAAHVGVDLHRFTVNAVSTAPAVSLGDQRISPPKPFDPEAKDAYDRDLTQSENSDESSNVPREAKLQAVSG